MASSSTVAAALSSVVTAADGEPAVKKAHTVSEDVTKGMSQDNQALFAAIQAMVETKMEKRFDKVDRAMTAMAEATDKGFMEVKKELDKVKSDMKAIDDKGPREAASSGDAQVPKPRARSVGARSGFVPKKVFVQGFFDFGAETGSLKPAKRDDLAKKLVDELPEHLEGRFKLEKKYVNSRRLVFNAVGAGGEECWELREKFVLTIESQGMEVNGKTLKVRIEEEPERQNKRQSYWRAVDAIKAVAAEGQDFILEPATFRIFDAKEMECLGAIADDAYA